MKSSKKRQDAFQLCFKQPRDRPLGGKMEPGLWLPQHPAGICKNGSETRKTPKHRYLWQIRTVTPPWGLGTLFRLLKKEEGQPPRGQPARRDWHGTHTSCSAPTWHRAHTSQQRSFCPARVQRPHCEEEQASTLLPPRTANPGSENGEHYEECAGPTKRSNKTR